MLLFIWYYDLHLFWAVTVATQTNPFWQLWCDRSVNLQLSRETQTEELIMLTPTHIEGKLHDVTNHPECQQAFLRVFMQLLPKTTQLLWAPVKGVKNPIMTIFAIQLRSSFLRISLEELAHHYQLHVFLDKIPNPWPHFETLISSTCKGDQPAPSTELAEHTGAVWPGAQCAVHQAPRAASPLANAGRESDTNLKSEMTVIQSRCIQEINTDRANCLWGTQFIQTRSYSDINPKLRNDEVFWKLLSFPFQFLSPSHPCI